MRHMSVSATRTLAAIGVLTAGVACATLFRKAPDPDAATVADRATSRLGVQWQAAPYPDAVSLPNSVATWTQGLSAAEPSEGGDAATLATSAATLAAGAATADTDRYATSQAATTPEAALGTLATDTGRDLTPTDDTRRLPASIGGPTARPRDPLASAKQPPDLAPRYGDALGGEHLGTSTRRLPPMPAPTHVIRDGDTLESIARRYLGDANRWQEIYELNRQVLPDAEILPIGLELRLPPLGLVPVKRPQDQGRAVVDFASSRSQ